MDRASGGVTGSYRWGFGKAEFDEGRWQLSVEGQAVELERKPLEVLQYLLRHAGEAVTKEELLSSVWAGRVVVEAVLTNAVGKLRRALGEDTGAMITTLPKVGYRLEGQVNRRTVEYIPPGSRLAAGDAVPRRGNWQLEEALARGGDGEVWLARHAKTGQVRVFKFSLDGQRLHGLKREVTVARLLEQALGERREFVKLIDWDFEQAPYFVEFEYGGTGLDRWRDPAGRGIEALPLAIRLELFCQAADAVAQAHGVGVLHKDVKPANLLLAGEPDALHLRVADFGSSRVFEPGMLEGLGITGLGLTQTQALSADSGTPLYLAPEVVAGQAPTVKSDVYALGVTLYQLVVGDFRRPLAPGWESDIDDALLRQDIADAANGDAARRLESATALAARIRDLAGRRERKTLEEAVRARVAEGERKLARVRARRPWVAAALVTLAVGLVASGVMWQRSEQQARLAQEQRMQAEKQAKRAEAVVGFLSSDLIRAVAPGGEGFEKDPTIRQMVEFASKNVDRKFAGDPATLGSLHAALGASWSVLDGSTSNPRSVDHFRKALENYRLAFGEAEELTLITQYNLVEELGGTAQFDEALKVMTEADALAGNRLEQETKLALRAAMVRGGLYVQWQKPDEAEPALARAAQLLPKVLPDQPIAAAMVMGDMADIYRRQGKAEVAEALLKNGLAEPRFSAASIGQVNRGALQSTLAYALRDLRKFPEALVMAEEAVSASEEVAGPDARPTLTRLAMVALVHQDMGDCRKALEIRRQLWESGLRRYGNADRATLVGGGNLALLERECGDAQAGLHLLREIHAGIRKHFGKDDAFTNTSGYFLTRWLVDAGHYREAEGFLRDLSVERLNAASGPIGWEHWLAIQRGRIRVGMGDVRGGRRLLLPALDALEQREGNSGVVRKQLAEYRQLLVDPAGGKSAQ